MTKEYFECKWFVIDIMLSAWLIRQLTGVYVLKFKKIDNPVIYVGSTKKLASRINSHYILSLFRNHPTLPTEVEILFLSCRNLKIAREKESFFIRKLKPEMNVYGTKNWKGYGSGKFDKEQAFYNICNKFLETDFTLPE